MQLFETSLQLEIVGALFIYTKFLPRIWCDLFILGQNLDLRKSHM